MQQEGAVGTDREGARSTPRVVSPPRSLVSTRLTRELLAADARADAEGDDPAQRAERLLDVVLECFPAQAGALVRYDTRESPLSSLAARFVPPGAVATLEGRGDAESLVRRACAERRLFVLERATREPLFAEIRGEVAAISAAAVVPLLDRGTPIAALFLATVAPKGLEASAFRLLAPAFHLLGILLSPVRLAAERGVAAPEGQEHERLVVEMEELENLLREAREASSMATERADAAEAEHRAELEGFRARIAELEANASRVDVAETVRRDLELSRQEQAERLAEAERRLAGLEVAERRLTELEAENLELRTQIDTLEALAAVGAESIVVGVSDSADQSADERDRDEREIEQMVDTAVEVLAGAGAVLANGDAGTTVDLEDAVLASGDADALAIEGDEGGVESELAPMAESGRASGAEPRTKAAAAVAGAGGAAGEESGTVAAPVSDALGAATLLGIESDPDVREAISRAAEHAGVATRFGEAEPGDLRGRLLMNLFDPGIGRASDLVRDGRAESTGLVYACDHEAKVGIEIGEVTWLPRPLDVELAAERMRGLLGSKASAVVIIGSQLRELSPLRDILNRGGVSSSVACDARQALDLLDIVRRPGALLIDLALEGGNALSIAAHCRTDSDLRDVPLAFLLGPEVQATRLLASARRSGALASFGAHEVARMVTAALSKRR